MRKGAQHGRITEHFRQGNLGFDNTSVGVLGRADDDAAPLVAGQPAEVNRTGPITGYVAGDGLGNTMLFSHVLAGHSIGAYRKAKATSERVLLKFHGDCRSRDGRVLGKTEYEKAYCNGSPIKEELTTIYRNHSILCLGCSLGPDRTVGLLAEVAKIDPGMPKHYAFLQHPNDADALRDREHFLTERDVFPIWYPDDHDESIQALFVGMMQYLGRL